MTTRRTITDKPCANCGQKHPEGADKQWCETARERLWKELNDVKVTKGRAK